MFPHVFGTYLSAVQEHLDSKNISSPNLERNRRSTGNRHRNRGYALEEISHISNNTFTISCALLWPKPWNLEGFL